MSSVLAKSSSSVIPLFPGLSLLRTAERGALAFFVYVAVLGLLNPVSWPQEISLALSPILLYATWAIESRTSRPWSRVGRDWAALPLILMAYWSLEWFRPAPHYVWQSEWVALDRKLLGPLGLRSLIEIAGPVFPFLLETLYLLLYTLPILALGLLYALDSRSRVDRYLAILFAGTFVAYALLPHFSVRSPRLTFPGTDLPAFGSIPRSINTWLLDHFDISTSAFPSGHVAVAFSSAFGLFTVFRNRRAIWLTAFIVASLIYVATIYARYHYAVDGLASICISFIAWRCVEYWSSREA